MTEYLRMSGLYWGLTAFEILGGPPTIKPDDIVEMVKICHSPCGGIAPSRGHDPHILYTLSAVQVNYSNTPLKFMIYFYRFYLHITGLENWIVIK